MSVIYTGDDMLQAADCWAEHFPAAWEEIERLALKDYHNGYRGSINYYVECVRRDPRFRGKLDDYKVNNTLRAAMARKLKAKYPQLHIETRKSKADMGATK